MDRKQITFVFNNIIGGIATMNLGIIEQAQLCKSFDIRVILITKPTHNPNGIVIGDKNIDVQIFNYCDYDNYHLVLKALKELLDKKNGYVVTNDGLELDCIKHLGTELVVINIVHDLYNLKLALNYNSVIDYFICHTVEISRLLRSEPDLKKSVKYLPFGVPIPSIQKRNNDTLKVVSLSRLTEGKGVLKLINIENELCQMGINVEWLILGTGPSKRELLNQWKNKSNVIFEQPDNDQLKQILNDADIFISLSEFEGYGISLLEAMSYGLVPIITKLPIGIHSLKPNNCGLVLDVVDFRLIADFIGDLRLDNSKLISLKNRSLVFVKENYSSTITGYGYFDFFNENLFKRTTGFKMQEISNFGFFDKKYLPNQLSFLLKRLKFILLGVYKNTHRS